MREKSRALSGYHARKRPKTPLDRAKQHSPTLADDDRQKGTAAGSWFFVRRVFGKALFLTRTPLFQTHATHKRVIYRISPYTTQASYTR